MLLHYAISKEDLMVFTIYDLFPIFITCFKYIILALGRFNVIPQDAFVFLTLNLIPYNQSWIGNATNYLSSNMLMSDIYTKKQLINESVISNDNTTKPYIVVYRWVNSHMLLTNLIGMFGLFAFFTLGYLAFFFFFPRRLKISFWNYFVRLCLLSYYTLTNLSILFMFSDSENAAMYFICACLLFFNTLCLPIYTYVAIKQRKQNLTDAVVRDKIGCIYLQYIPSCQFFTTFLLVKQGLYSLTFVIGHVELIERHISLTVQAIINTVFFIVLVKYKPFIEYRHQIQSVAISVVKYLILITSAILYAFEEEREYSFLIIMLNGVILAINLVIFLRPYLPSINRKIKKEVVNSKRCWRPRNILETLELRKDEQIANSELPNWVVADFMRDSIHRSRRKYSYAMESGLEMI